MTKHVTTVIHVSTFGLDQTPFHAWSTRGPNVVSNYGPLCTKEYWLVLPLGMSLQQYLLQSLESHPEGLAAWHNKTSLEARTN